MAITKNTYSKEIASLAEGVYKKTKGKSGKYDAAIDPVLSKHPWRGEEKLKIEILEFSPNKDAIFDLNIIPLLLESDDLSCVEDFYYYASYYAMYKDVHVQLKELENSNGKN